ncbi:uncharacterized protein RB166_006797 isoform 2-T2 [Leptodactylus fuscus]
MVVLDQTEDDLQNDNATSPASCDSSDSATAACPSDFQTIENIPRNHMVILDETNEDNDHPASPASCDSSASESSPSNPATTKSIDEIPRKKSRTEIPEDERSLLSVASSCSSSNSAPEAEAVHGKSEKSSSRYYSKKHHANSGKTGHKESRKTFQMEPVKSNEDVFKFLKTFAVANETDVAFAIKIKEMFSDALRKYKETKLEEIFCTEAEHSSPEEIMESSNDPSNNEQINSCIPQSTTSECVRIHSGPGSPANASPIQFVANPTSSTYCQLDSPVINPSGNPDASSTGSRSPTNVFKALDTSTSNQPFATNSTDDNPCSATETDLLMESESCVTAEADCSDDDV